MELKTYTPATYNLGQRMTDEDNLMPQVEKGFARAVPNSHKKHEFEKAMVGAKKLKRRILGFCGKKTVMSVDELASTLNEIGVVETTTEGKDFVSKLLGLIRFDYNNNTSLYFSGPSKKLTNNSKITIKRYQELGFGSILPEQPC
jgi:hypothetical protein